MRVSDFEALAQPGIRGLRAYDPGHDLVALRRRFADNGLVELGSNENALGPSPSVRAAIDAALPLLHRYPDPLGGDLKRALAGRLGVGVDEIALGNGSHELLMLLAQVFAGPGCDVLMSRYGFAVYALAAQAVGAGLRMADALPRTDPMPLGHDPAALAAAADPRTRLLYLANPNNPTGTWMELEAIETLLERLPARVIVVIDEAYAEYADTGNDAGGGGGGSGPRSALALRARFPNLVVTRTFSKAYGLAGLRIGHAVANPALVALIERLRESFNVNALALAAAQAALADEQHLARVVAQNAAQRARLAAGLAGLGLRVFPSRTNFLLVEFAQGAGRARAVEAALLERGIVPRPMAGYGLPDCLRITVGTPAENRRLLDELGSIR
jgi:histidinol-phosphate aminotransferase